MINKNLNYNFDINEETYYFDSNVNKEKKEIINTVEENSRSNRNSDKGIANDALKKYINDFKYCYGQESENKFYDNAGNMIRLSKEKWSFKNLKIFTTKEEQIYNDKGSLICHSYYENNQNIWLKYFYSDGSPMIESELKDGLIYSSEYRNNKKYIQSIYDNKAGLCLDYKVYYKNGNLCFNSTYDGHAFNSEFFSPDNKLIMRKIDNNENHHIELYYSNSNLYYSGNAGYDGNGILIPLGYGEEYDEEGKLINGGKYDGTFILNSFEWINSTQKFKDFENQISGLTQYIKSLEINMDKIKEDTKYIRDTQDVILNEFSSLKEEMVDSRNHYLKQLEQAWDNQEKQEILISQLSDEFMKYSQKMCEAFEAQSNGKTDYYEENLKKLFGNSWGKLCEESRRFLVTSEVVYHNLLNTEGEIDFSAACIPLTKAIEKEIYIHLFSTMRDLLPSENRDSRWNFYTLGSINTICDDEYKNIFNKVVSANFYRNSLDSPANKENFRKTVNNITYKYRNKAAHRDGISLKTAKECRDYIVFVQKVLIDYMNWIK